MKGSAIRFDSQRHEAACRREAISAAVQRRIIYKALIERANHPTARRVYAEVRRRPPGVSRTTVYRTLEKFADPGLARRTHPHHHLVCTSCDKVSDLATRDLRVQVRRIRCHGFASAAVRSIRTPGRGCKN